MTDPNLTGGAAIYTIGHGNRSIEEFTALLRQSAIACLMDVRAFPGSRRYPHFGRRALEASLPAVGIEYVWEGARLGGRRRPRIDSAHTALRNTSYRAYADHMESDEFREAAESLVRCGESSKVAIMCAERLPWQCHRYMIADYLVAHGTEVRHIIEPRAPGAHTLRREARLEGERLIYDRNTQAGLGLT